MAEVTLQRILEEFEHREKPAKPEGVELPVEWHGVKYNAVVVRLGPETFGIQLARVKSDG